RHRPDAGRADRRRTRTDHQALADQPAGPRRVHHRRVHHRRDRRGRHLPSRTHPPDHRQPHGHLRRRLPRLPTARPVHHQPRRTQPETPRPRRAHPRPPPPRHRPRLRRALPAAPAHGRTHHRLAHLRQPPAALPRHHQEQHLAAHPRRRPEPPPPDHPRPHPHPDSLDPGLTNTGPTHNGAIDGRTPAPPNNTSKHASSARVLQGSPRACPRSCRSFGRLVP